MRTFNVLLNVMWGQVELWLLLLDWLSRLLGWWSTFLRVAVKSPPVASRQFMDIMQLYATHKRGIERASADHRISRLFFTPV